MIKKLLFLFFIFLLNGCGTTNVPHSNDYLHYSAGALSISAYSENPHLDCSKVPEIARLDKQENVRVFIIDGESCK